MEFTSKKAKIEKAKEKKQRILGTWIISGTEEE